MRVIRSAQEMSRLSGRWQRQGKRIGVVPTMGALHEGHCSLIRRAARDNDAVIVTIFVNPLQFGPKEDFARYPRPFARDVRVARTAGADIIFAPRRDAMYPERFQTHIDPGPLALRWEGEHRPGHFRGVVTIVLKLFELTRPTNAYFGQKDYQQACIIQRMIRDLDLPIRMRWCPIIREPDGLAMSSRNAYLTPSQRAQAPVVWRALRSARRRMLAGERRAARIQQTMRRCLLRASKARIEYAAVVDAATLAPQRRASGRIALLIAVRLGGTRLIDNLLVDVP